MKSVHMRLGSDTPGYPQCHDLILDAGVKSTARMWCNTLWGTDNLTVCIVLDVLCNWAHKRSINVIKIAQGLLVGHVWGLSCTIYCKFTDA